MLNIDKEMNMIRIYISYYVIIYVLLIKHKNR